MSDEKTVGKQFLKDHHRNANGSPTKAVFGNAADIVHNVIELAELQTKLLAANLQTMKRRIVIPIMLLVLVCLTVAAVLPVTLLGVAELFVVFTRLSRTTSYFAAAGCGLLTAVLLGMGAWWGIRRSFSDFEISRRELERNVNWIKTTLKRSGN